MNILTILAETRAALCVWNPANFVKGTLTVTRSARAKS
jgi:conjugal transfer/entry exclusion protein